MRKIFFSLVLVIMVCFVNAQVRWVNLDSLYQPLPSSMHVYKSTDSLDGKPNVMYYAIANLKDKNLKFTSDTSKNRKTYPGSVLPKK